MRDRDLPKKLALRPLPECFAFDPPAGGCR